MCLKGLSFILIKCGLSVYIYVDQSVPDLVYVYLCGYLCIFLCIHVVLSAQANMHTHMAGQDVTDNDPSFSVHLQDIIQGDKNKPEGREGGHHGTVIC